MKSAPLPECEKLRLQTLENYQVLDTEAEQCFDDITELASVICETPISLVSLVDEERQWFKSKVGLDVDQTSREIAFCSHAILQEHVFEIEDALQDERFFDNPLVTSGPKIRFYAGAPLHSPCGQTIGTLCTISDKPNKLDEVQKMALKTLAKQVIAQLELRLKVKQLNNTLEAKDNFLSTISHELRTPLNAITGFSEILRESPEVHNLPIEQVKYINNIDFSGRQLLEIVNSVLDLEKINAGKMELKPEPILLAHLLKNISEMMSVKARQANLALRFDIAPNLSHRYFQLDKTKFTQVITNIVGNAIKFTPANKSIDARFDIKTESIISIEVKDQGDGISEQDQSLLFNKYKQVGNQQKEGTGLGLCITKGFVELMGGSIEITSELGKGTTVQILLPITECHKVNPHKPVAPNNLEKINVCIVEDNYLNQLLIKAILNQFSCQFSVFDSAEALFEQQHLNRFDIYLFDINLPGMSGIEAANKLNYMQIKQPKIAITADIFQDKNLNTHFDDIIIKPYKKSDIIKILNQIS